MYQACAYEKSTNTVHIWDDKKGHLKIKYKPYCYERSDYGDMVALDGNRVKKIDTPAADHPGLYESDIAPDVRTLIDMYTDSDEPSIGHRVMYIDIEVDIKDGYPTPEEAQNEITSIALYDEANDHRYVFILDKEGIVETTKKERYVVISCIDERTLITSFMSAYNKINPTIITGWNIDFFDIPYLVNRMNRVMSETYARQLSPIGDVFWLQHRNRYRIAGVSCLDYIALYKNFTYSQESSYSLEAISQKELGKGKMQYDGTLDDLFRNDIQGYIDYNMNDVDLVYEIDQKLRLIDLARSICHKGHVTYEDFLFPTRYLDGAALTYLKRKGIVAPNKPPKSDEPLNLLGAFVKPPNPGRYKWVYDLDLTSLYPSIIMTLNISPETKVTKLEMFDGIDFVKGKGSHYTDGWNGWETPEDLRNYLVENDYSIAANGVIYDKKIKGFLPSILDQWFDERVEFKNLRKKYEKEGDKAKAEYYDQRQLVTKILLNSFYGVLGNASFRFFDPHNAVGTTSTGQQLIKFTADIGNKYYINELGEKKDYCIYTDTDSTFFSSLPIIKKRYPDFDIKDEDFMAKATIEIASEVQDFINNAYDIYALKFHNVTEHRFDIKQEFVAKAGLWVAKKRYAQWLINQEGHTISKLDVKGLDVVRSSFPSAFRKFMAEVLEDILNDIDKQDLDTKVLDFKDHIKELPLLEVMSPVGVKKIKKYLAGKGQYGLYKKGTPVHVKAAINYNEMLYQLGINTVKPISNGEKIKWAYLKANPLHLQALALTGNDDPEEIVNFVTTYIDYDHMFKSAFHNKLGDFYSALGWGAVPENNNLNKFFEF